MSLPAVGFVHVVRAAAAALVLGTAAWSTQAQTTRLLFDSFVESKSIATPLLPGGQIRLDGRLRDGDLTSITNELRFVAGSSSISLAAAWLVNQTSGNRTVGVNIDLLDASNAVVASDVFLGANGDLARSQFTATGLVVGGAYRLVVTGTALEAGRYGIALAAGDVMPVLDPLVAVSPPPNIATFDTHVGEKNFGDRLSNGDSWVIEGSVLDDIPSAITNTFNFTSDASNISAGIEWITGAAGDVVRTVGVNVDLLANATVVASDSFQGITNGQAFSQFALLNSAIGQYSLVFTGTAEQEGRYRIHLGTSAVAPGFEPINPVTAVPEPETWMLLAAGLAWLGARSRHALRPT